MTVNILVGIKIKDIDSLSGKDTQIAVIDRDGFREISPNEQPNYYETMIEFIQFNEGFIK